MLAEIIREFTKTDENTHVTSKQVLAWAKGVLNSLGEVKEFDKYKQQEMIRSKMG